MTKRAKKAAVFDTKHKSIRFDDNTPSGLHLWLDPNYCLSGVEENLAKQVVTHLNKTGFKLKPYKGPR